MPRNFDDLLSSDRTFIVRGETFTWRDVRPEVLTSFGEINGDDPNAVWQAQDEQILQFLIPEDHERWKRLRKQEENPITLRQFNAILEYLVSEQTDRPTQTPSPSGGGRGKTAVSSKDE
ncbi:MAG: hypothetical protein KatS3mg015_2560 [Fimbriimonadales bacterium]|nr:MAG: hypothetical protein KatS3mg015_2560 [Fimbriimonadales bacterium]